MGWIQRWLFRYSLHMYILESCTSGQGGTSLPASARLSPQSLLLFSRFLYAANRSLTAICNPTGLTHSFYKIVFLRFLYEPILSTFNRCGVIARTCGLRCWAAGYSRVLHKARSRRCHSVHRREILVRLQWVRHKQFQ